MRAVSDGAATTWGLGDYPAMAQRLEPAAERAVELAEVGAGDRVLDIGCGTGNAALLASARGARVVVGVDPEPRLLAVASERAADVLWLPAGATSLPLPDAEFDVLLSVFGVMYEPDQEAAAQELARVCAPGARIALASWASGSFMPAMGAALAPFLPPPPAGGAPPSRWGDRDQLTALLAPVGIDLERTSSERIPLQFRSPIDAVGFLVRTAGHVIAERDRLTAEGRWPGLLAALGALVAERAEDGPRGIAIELEYALALALASI
jgi:SAM-dependent methyltransferase